MNKVNNSLIERKYKKTAKKNYINMSIKELKNVAKHIKPTIQIGKNGLSENTVLEIKKQLKTKKLVKIRLL
jgi:RNA-binding protein YhbY